MRIKMKITAVGSEDGFTAQEFAQDGEYEVGEALAQSFIACGMAEAAGVKPHPLDHDGDGRPGGSPAGENATRRRGRKPKGEE